MKRIILVFASCFSFAISDKECTKYYQSCSACIQTPGCAWNSNANFEMHHCFSIDEASTNIKNIYNPQTSVTITKNLPINETILLAPQNATVRLRLKTRINLIISVATSDSITSTHLDNINVELIRDKPQFVLAQIEALKCPTNPGVPQIITVGSNHTNQSLTIVADILCTCPCEHPDQLIHNAPQCNHRGSYQCGACKCLEGYFGDSCACQGDPDHMGNGCLRKGDNLECSGRGQCVCGRCECEHQENPEKIIFGRYCECDNFSCPRFNGKVCGGQERGKCECGQCQCEMGFSGENCGVD